MTPSSKHLRPGVTRRDLLGWAMYDFANSGYATVVLTAVFLPAAFIPGITGQMYRQFALVIAATAVLSGINAITLKPTQSAQYLRAHDPSHRPNAFSRNFNAAFETAEHAYIRFIGALIRNKKISALGAIVLMAGAGYGFVSIPTAFIPTEDQGYVMVAVQLPDGASLQRTTAALDKVVQIGRATPGVAHAVAISGISPVDGNTSLSNAGLVYLVLDDWAITLPDLWLKSRTPAAACWCRRQSMVLDSRAAFKCNSCSPTAAQTMEN